jgi:hypothetical protein
MPNKSKIWDVVITLSLTIIINKYKRIKYNDTDIGINSNKNENFNVNLSGYITDKCNNYGVSENSCFIVKTLKSFFRLTVKYDWFVHNYFNNTFLCCKYFIVGNDNYPPPLWLNHIVE